MIQLTYTWIQCIVVRSSDTVYITVYSDTVNLYLDTVHMQLSEVGYPFFRQKKFRRNYILTEFLIRNSRIPYKFRLKNSVWKIPWNSAEFFWHNKIPRNSVKNSAEFRLRGILWHGIPCSAEFRGYRIPWKNSDGIPWKFRRNSVKNSEKLPAGFWVHNDYFYEPLRNSK